MRSSFVRRRGDGPDGAGGVSCQLRSVLQYEQAVPPDLHATGEEGAPTTTTEWRAPRATEGVANASSDHFGC